jgi:hypothetical protein
MLMQGFLLLLVLLLLASLQHDVLAVVCSSLAHAEEVFRSPEEDLFYSPMPEKSYGTSWRGTFFIPQLQKSLLVPEVRPFTFPHEGKVFRSMERDLFHSYTADCLRSLGRHLFQPQCRKSLTVHVGRPFSFPHAGKGFTPGISRLFLLTSPSRNQKTSPA